MASFLSFPQFLRLNMENTTDSFAHKKFIMDPKIINPSTSSV